MSELHSPDTMPQPVKLRIEDYLALEEAGAFDRYTKIELLDGELFYVNSQHRSHALLKMKLYDALRDALRRRGSNLTPLVEATIAIPGLSLPEPDLVLTSEAEGEGFIPLASVALVIEVADSTLAGDLTRKAQLYARAGIPEYWVADIAGRQLHQLSAPASDGYEMCLHLPFGERVNAATLPLSILLPE